MLEEIDYKQYQEYDTFPIETKKAINKYREFSILNDVNSGELYKYYVFDENEMRRIIKKDKNTCLITTFDKKNNQSHIDIIHYRYDHTIDELIRIDYRNDGFVYLAKRISDEDAIVIYKKQRDNEIEMKFSPVPPFIRCPVLEIREMPDQLVSYLFGNGLGKSPNIVILGDLEEEYTRKDKDGFYSLTDAGIITKLRYFLSGSKIKTLQEIEKEHKVSYPLNSTLLNILQHHMVYYENSNSKKHQFKEKYPIKVQGLIRPYELINVLNAIDNNRISDNEDDIRYIFRPYLKRSSLVEKYYNPDSIDLGEL